ncbi:hypothetical protein CC78DRAFT_528941 [Lojkania enalia]|uniref:Uncharacterized protein n=1 Tax=Lojkania enalia TaxID=147567 RepID=A0A9P4NAU8_9PLEO|nr:hypothetical protein CC78DRAFT_528941 [Didymosphaeria enalia]
MTISALERLPAELIQPIFLQSGPNLALVDVSPYIAAKLANNYLYKTICETYFTRDLNSRSEQSSAQTRIFASKWMTWDYFKSFVMRTWSSMGCLCGKTPNEGCFDPQWPPNFEDATAMAFSRRHIPALSYIKCRIPVKLLHGPWNRSKAQYLRFLLWTTSMTVDWASPETRRLALEGKKEAILDRNLEVVELFNHNRRLGKAPNMDMVRFAVMEAGCDRSIVYDTMAMAREWGLRGDSWKCNKLDTWCEAKLEQGDPKGKWLQLKLKELRTTYESRDWIRSTMTGDQEVGCGYMHPKTGDYDDVDGDKLVITPRRWNQVSTFRFRTTCTRDW